MSGIDTEKVGMTKEELKDKIFNAMIDVWLAYEQSIGVEYGDVHFSVEFEIDELYEKIAELIIYNFDFFKACEEEAEKGATQNVEI